ncbi:hypothetical protein MKW92_048403 [Papaver armeniacum]|nr:hypothetical protein MKW92_048403 [Papaver armeniacum]
MDPLVPRCGDAIFAKVERVLFTLTYGAMVRQLLTDLEEVEEVNKRLDRMGYNIGIRLIDEFLAKSNVSRCVDFKESVISQNNYMRVGFKMFLGILCKLVTNWDADGTSCASDTCQGLYYCNVLSGVIERSPRDGFYEGQVTWVRDMCCVEMTHDSGETYKQVLKSTLTKTTSNL